MAGAVASRHALRWRLSAAFAGLAVLTALLVGLVLLPSLAARYTRADETYGAALAERAAKELAAADWSSRELLAAEAERIAAATLARVRLIDRKGDVAAEAPAPVRVDTATADLYLPGLVDPSGVTGSVARAFSVDVLPKSGPPLGTVELLEVPAYGAAAFGEAAGSWAMASLLAVALAALVGLVIAVRLTRPLLALQAAADRMAAGDLGARTGLRGADEVGHVAVSFDAMADQVEATVESLRRFVADAAHELGTPLTALQADLDLAAAAVDAEARDRNLDRAQVQLERLDTLRQGLLVLSRLDAPAHAAVTDSPADLVAVTQETLRALASRADQAEVALDARLSGVPLPVACDRGRLAGVVVNLVDNALKFTPRGGRVTVTVDGDGGVEARLLVADTGIGIAADELPLVFGRFHRGRNTQAIAGSGLGLAIVRATVERAGGRVAIASEPGQGTRVTVVLPRAMAGAQVTDL